MTHGRWSSLLLLLALLPTSAEATKLSGMVLDSELGGPPMAGVQIGAAGANPTTTGNLGLFTLDFPGQEPGDVVKLTIAKAGYLVVNDIQLQTTLPRVAAGHPLTLLLCQPQACEEMRRRFYRLKGLEAVEEAYKRQLAELEQRNQATAAERDRLRQERDEARAVAEKAAEDFARISPGEGSEIYREALRLFVDGKLDEALAVLDEAKLQSELQAARTRIEEVTQSYLLRGQLLTLQLKFDEAEKAYEAAVASNAQSFEAHNALACFAANQKQQAKAIAAQQQSLELARKQGSAADVANMLSNLGNLLSAQNRLDEARKDYDEALEIQRQLAQKNPDAHLPYVARTLNNRGVLLRDQNRLDEARKDYDEALEIQRQLAQKNPKVYLPDLASTLNNLGILLSDKNLNEARKAFDKALDIRRQLAQKNPEVYLPDLATTLNNLGLLDSIEECWTTGRDLIEEALGIRRELAAANPAAFLPNVANSLSALAFLHHQEGQTDKARQVAEEALAIYAPFAADNPAGFEGRVEPLKWLLSSLDAPH